MVRSMDQYNAKLHELFLRLPDIVFAATCDAQQFNSTMHMLEAYILLGNECTVASSHLSLYTGGDNIMASENHRQAVRFLFAGVIGKTKQKAQLYASRSLELFLAKVIQYIVFSYFKS